MISAAIANELQNSERATRCALVTSTKFWKLWPLFSVTCGSDRRACRCAARRCSVEPNLALSSDSALEYPFSSPCIPFITFLQSGLRYFRRIVYFSYDDLS